MPNVVFKRTQCYVNPLMNKGFRERETRIDTHIEQYDVWAPISGLAGTLAGWAVFFCSCTKMQLCRMWSPVQQGQCTNCRIYRYYRPNCHCLIKGWYPLVLYCLQRARMLLLIRTQIHWWTHRRRSSKELRRWRPSKSRQNAGSETWQ